VALAAASPGNGVAVFRDSDDDAELVAEINQAMARYRGFGVNSRVRFISVNGLGFAGRLKQLLDIRHPGNELVRLAGKIGLPVDDLSLHLIVISNRPGEIPTDINVIPFDSAAVSDPVMRDKLYRAVLVIGAVIAAHTYEVASRMVEDVVNKQGNIINPDFDALSRVLDSLSSEFENIHMLAIMA
jgi:hypothetical protein